MTKEECINFLKRKYIASYNKYNEYRYKHVSTANKYLEEAGKYQACIDRLKGKCEE